MGTFGTGTPVISRFGSTEDKWEYTQETVKIKGLIECTSHTRSSLTYTVTKNIVCKCGPLPPDACAKINEPADIVKENAQDLVKKGWPYLFKGFEIYHPRSVKFEYEYDLITCVAKNYSPCKENKCKMETTIGPKDFGGGLPSFKQLKSKACSILAKMMAAKMGKDFCTPISSVYKNFRNLSVLQLILASQLGMVDTDLRTDDNWQNQLKECKKKMPKWCLREELIPPSNALGGGFEMAAKNWMPHPSFNYRVFFQPVCWKGAMGDVMKAVTSSLVPTVKIKKKK